MDENLHPSTLPPQTDGSYWNVIESEKMQQVLEKLDREEYAYQLS
jgi:hypothetical protein